MTDLGPLAACARCGKLCRVATARASDARMLRAAAQPDGYCLECAVTAWLLDPTPGNPSMIADALREDGPALLRDALALPPVREALRAAFVSGKADAQFEDVDWERAIANWSLPWT